MTLQEAATPDALSPTQAEAVLVVAQRIVARLAKPVRTTNQPQDLRTRLKGFTIPFSAPDSSGRWDYRWPGSRLTGDDMRKLHVIGNYAGLPSNELIHVAVGLLYAQTREFVLHLLTIHERTGKPFPDIMTEVAGTGAEASRSSDTGPAEDPQSPACPRLRLHPASIPATPDAPTSAWTSEVPPAMVAELNQSAARVEPVPPSTMSPRKSPSTGNSRSAAEDEPLADEVRQLRDEIRVLWQTIDELRDSLEHAIRNLPDRLPPPVRIWSMPADPTAADFGERINAVSAEQMETLRTEAVRAAEGRPTPPQSARQGRLFS